MSSATSIERVNAKGVADVDSREHDRAERDTFKPWHFFVLASLVAATVAVVLARQARPEHLVLISLTIGAAGFAAAALYRALMPLVSPEAVNWHAPLTESTRATLEREKLLTLRAIKELEFDRAMGKVSPKDFEEMAGRLRTRALSLMKQLDAGAGSYRELIDRELDIRLQKAESKAAGKKRPAGRPAVPSETSLCSCGTANDPDAAFCKRCGTKIGRASAT